MFFYRAILPTTMFDAINDFLGANDVMNEFIGRKFINWDKILFSINKNIINFQNLNFFIILL